MPAYETIQPHHTDRNELELAERGEHGYDILNRGINTNSETTVGLLEIVDKESKEESYSKLELPQRSNLVHNSVGIRGSSQEEYKYNKLEMLNIEPDVPRDANADDSKHDERSEEKEIMNSSVDEKNVDETSLECDNYQQKNGDSEKEQKEKEPESPQSTSCMPEVTGPLR